MIKRICFLLFTLCLFIAIPLALAGVSKVELGEPFLIFMRACNRDLSSFKIEIPNIPDIPRIPESVVYRNTPYNTAGSVLGVLINIGLFLSNFASVFLTIVNGLIVILNVIIRILNIFLDIINIVIQLIEFLVIMVKKLINLKEILIDYAIA